MSEVDYQMALLLQYKFEQEHKHKQTTDSDQLLALELHQQFQTEAAIERPSNNLVYNAPALNTSKCLVDPSWEVIDPTPDIHVLFMAFNQKFFWNTLGSVTVAWSKRMTTCAGICAYQGRGGMCSITLSEPLLKLRPRKDLVETLLHEMIHAYLFVTNNNRDRDGHGPEFHKHMFRINAEAGTHITVYHSFHDEVRLYKQHWWRCDGPCQTSKPYFGMVRRAVNRPPGPNDFWWGEHTRNCGGTFIKVKSPEKPNKPPPKKADKKNGGSSKQPEPVNDIRNYISTNSKAPLSNLSNKENKALPNVQKPHPNNMSKPQVTSSLSTNIRTVPNSSSSSSQVTNVIPSKTSNIFGFTNLSGNSSSTPKRPITASGIKGAVKNAGSSTFVVTKRGGNSLSSTRDGGVGKTRTNSASVEAFSGAGRSLSSDRLSSLSNADYSRVREHWLKKFENSNGGTKRSSTDGPFTSSKIPKLSQFSESDNTNKVECPVCKKKFKVEDLNSHLDTCLEPSNLDTKECFICGSETPKAEFQRHVSECSEKHFKDDGVEDNDVFTNLTQCPSCLEQFDPTSFVKHKEHCKDSNMVDLTRSDSVEDIKNCPVCKEALSSAAYDIHVEKCILKMCDEFDQKYEPSQDARTLCLACNKEILKSELNSHLEECMSISNVFETSTSAVEDHDEDSESACDIKGSYNCPFCLKLVLEKEMQGHLDQCLIIDDCTEKGKDKSLLVESLCSTDSDLE